MCARRLRNPLLSTRRVVSRKSSCTAKYLSMASVRDALRAAAADVQASHDEDDPYGQEDFDSPPPAREERKTAETILGIPDRRPSSATGTSATKEPEAELVNKLAKTSLLTYMNSLKSAKPKKQEPKPVLSQAKMDTLSKPKPVTDVKFSRPEDEEECKFMPQISSKSKSMIPNRRDYDQLIMQLESKEATRRQAIEKARGEADYNARQDKLVCPECGAAQTYAEYIGRIKKCQNPACGGKEFRTAKAWGDIEKGFLERLARSEKKRQERMAKIMAETQPQFRQAAKTVIDPVTHQAKTVKVQPRNWKEVSSSFLSRMEEDAKAREEKRLKLEQEAAAARQLAARGLSSTSSIASGAAGAADGAPTLNTARSNTSARPPAVATTRPARPQTAKARTAPLRA